MNQRLVGEIHRDEFEVSHTKDDIHWVDDEEDQVQNGSKRFAPSTGTSREEPRRAGSTKQAAIQIAAAEST